MRYEIVYEKELEEMTDNEKEEELKESFSNIRKIAILEKLSFSEWTKDELIEVILHFILYKSACSLDNWINTISEFVKSGTYKEYEKEFEEYKIIELTEEMKKEFSIEKREKIRPQSILDQTPFIEWNKRELLEFITKYNKNYEDW